MMSSISDLIDKLQQNRELMASLATDGADAFIASFLSEQASLISSITTDVANFQSTVSNILRSIIDGVYREAILPTPTIPNDVWDKTMTILPGAITNRFLFAAITITPPNVTGDYCGYFATNKGTALVPAGTPSPVSIPCKISVPVNQIGTNFNYPPDIKINTWQQSGTVWYPNKYTIYINLGNKMISNEGISIFSFIPTLSTNLVVHQIKLAYIATEELVVS